MSEAGHNLASVEGEGSHDGGSHRGGSRSDRVENQGSEDVSAVVDSTEAGAEEVLA